MWCLCGVCVVFVWCLCGVNVVFVWCLCGVCLVFVWFYLDSQDNLPTVKGRLCCWWCLMQGKVSAITAPITCNTVTAIAKSAPSKC